MSPEESGDIEAVAEWEAHHNPYFRPMHRKCTDDCEAEADEHCTRNWHNLGLVALQGIPPQAGT